MSQEDAYPLQWPSGRPRTPSGHRSSSRFDVTPNQAQRDMFHQIALMGGKNVIVSTNLRLRKDGGIYAADMNKTPDDPGVAVYFERKGQRVCFSCDMYHRVWENIRAIGKTIEAMRGIARWGAEEALDRAFTGFAALPSPEARKHWSDVLNVPSNAAADDIKAAYRSAARTAAKQGDQARLQDLNVARDEALS